MSQRKDSRQGPREERLTFGRNIRRARLLQGMSQAVVAERAKLTVTFLSRLERGKSGVSIDNAALLAEVVQVPLHRLLDPDF